MFPILQIGPLALQLPGLFLLAGLWIGLGLVDRQAPRHRISADTLSSLILWSLAAGLIGARLWYALRFLDVYLADPLGLISLNPSTLAPTEGLATALVAALIFGQRRGLPLWPTLDAVTPSLAAFAIAVGFAHLASGDAFGAPAQLPWSIDLWGARRHPSQVYEILVAGMAFAAVWVWRGQRLPAGTLFLSWTGLAAASRLFLEAFRGDSVIVLGQLRGAQMASLAILGIALIALHGRVRAERKAEPPAGA